MGSFSRDHLAVLALRPKHAPTAGDRGLSHEEPPGVTTAIECRAKDANPRTVPTTIRKLETNAAMAIKEMERNMLPQHIPGMERYVVIGKKAHVSGAIRILTIQNVHQTAGAREPTSATNVNHFLVQPDLIWTHGKKLLSAHGFVAATDAPVR